MQQQFVEDVLEVSTDAEKWEERQVQVTEMGLQYNRSNKKVVLLKFKCIAYWVHDDGVMYFVGFDDSGRLRDRQLFRHGCMEILRAMSEKVVQCQALSAVKYQRQWHLKFTKDHVRHVPSLLGMA